MVSVIEGFHCTTGVVYVARAHDDVIDVIVCLYMYPHAELMYLDESS